MSSNSEREADASIEQIDKELLELQEEINKLVRKKKLLEEKKNSIKANKYLQKSFELSNQDWDQGKLIHTTANTNQSPHTPLPFKNPFNGASTSGISLKTPSA